MDIKLRNCDDDIEIQKMALDVIKYYLENCKTKHSYIGINSSILVACGEGKDKVVFTVYKTKTLIVAYKE